MLLGEPRNPAKSRKLSDFCSKHELLPDFSPACFVAWLTLATHVTFVIWSGKPSPQFPPFFRSRLPRGGYSNYFLTGCAARGLKPLPISKDFSTSKNGWFKAFFRNFRKSGPISKGFSTSKWLILQFFRDFCEMGPSSKDFFEQNGTHV